MTINTGKNAGDVRCGHTLDKTADSPEITLTATDIGQVVDRLSVRQSRSQYYIIFSHKTRKWGEMPRNRRVVSEVF